MKIKTNSIIQIGMSGWEFIGAKLDQLINTATRFNIDCIELFVPENVKPEEIPVARDMLQSKGIKVICVTTLTHLITDKDDYRQMQKRIIQTIDVAKSFSALYVNTYVGKKQQSTSRTEVLKVYTERIKPCLERAIKNDIAILIENEFDPLGEDITRRAENVLQLVENVGSKHLRLTFDLANFHIAGEEEFPFAYELLKNYIKYIHIKDTAKYSFHLHGEKKPNMVREDASGKYFYVPIGSGTINYSGFLKRLRTDRYHGVVMLEPHCPLSEIEQVYKHSLAFLEGELKYSQLA